MLLNKTRFNANNLNTFISIGLDVDFLKHLKVILVTLASGCPINIDKFRIYTEETAELYVRIYPWYPMSPTLHKVLIHGSEIAKTADIPLGQLSEEAQESRNKDYKKIRGELSRKCSRIATNQDVLHRLLFTSDPFIAKFREIPKKKEHVFEDAVINLLNL